jgi:histidyl-tRNA synthetase
MREANKYGSRFVIFIGGEEYENGKVQIKNMETGDQQLVDLNNLDTITSFVR